MPPTYQIQNFKNRSSSFFHRFRKVFILFLKEPLSKSQPHKNRMVSQLRKEDFHFESEYVSRVDLICLNHDDNFSLLTTFIIYSSNTMETLSRSLLNMWQ